MRVGYRRLRVWAVFCLCVAATLRPGQTHAQEQAEPPQEQAASRRPLSDVLVEFHTTTRVDLIWDSELVSGKWTSYRLEPGASPERMLRAMLQGMRIDFYRLDSGTYVLVPARDEALHAGSISGIILDETTGRPLHGAHVLLADASTGTTTNATGLFTFADLRPGRYRILATYLGYDVAVDTVHVRGGGRIQVQLALSPAPVPIMPLIVEDQRTAKPLAFAHLWRQEQIVQPRSMGTADVVRSLNQLMGVRVGDAMADVHVQGGETGEHQFRLDGVPVFEPVHLRGLLGAFNPFAIERITVHKAGFGVAHGSYLAGIIAAEHALVSPDQRTVDLQVDPLSLNARVHLETGRADGWRLQVMTAARTSLWGLYPASLSPFKNLLREWNTPDPFLPRASVFALEQADPFIGERVRALLDTLHLSPISDPTLGFNDLHAAARLQLDPERSLYVSFYRGWNRLNGNQLSVSVDPEETANPGPTLRRTGDDPAEERVATNRDDYRWINANGQVHFTTLIGSRTYAGLQLRGSRYSLGHAYNTLDSGSVQVFPDLDGRPIPVRLIEGVRPTDDGNGISELAAEGHLDHNLTPRHYLQLGAEAVRTAHRFTIEDVYYRPVSHTATGWRLAAFAEERAALTDRLTLTLGARLTLLQQHRAAFPEPRAELLYDVPRSRMGAWSVRLATGLYRQFVSQFNISSISPSALLPAIRFWLPVDSTVTPPKAYHVAGSVLLMPGNAWRLHAEAYYKHQPHLLSINYQALWTHLGAASDSAATVQRLFLADGKGFAYGGAVSLEWNSASTRLQARYDYSMAQRTRTLLPAQATNSLVQKAYRTAAQEDSLGRYEPVPWNEPHRLELAFDWTPSRYVTATARWRGIWGRAWAFRQAYYDYLATNPDMPSPVFGDYNLLEPHRHKLRPFSQLDVGVAYTHDFGPAALQVRMDVLNLLDRANEADWSLRPPEDEGQEPEQVARTLLPRTPSLALRLRW